MLAVATLHLANDYVCTVAYDVETSPGHNHSDTAPETFTSVYKHNRNMCCVSLYMIIKFYNCIHNISNCMCLT